MKTENKQYRLKRWYPSLPEELPVGAVITFCYGKAEWVYHPNSTLVFLVFKILKHELENPDFWEEVKQPLFVTEDGVELFDEADKLFIVNKKCYKKESKISNIYDKTNRKDFKYFFHESSADEYIWRNKRVFSYEDMMKAKHSIILTDEDIEKAAKKRSEQ